MSEGKAQYITGADGLTWQPVQVRLGDLDGWQGNPKTLAKHEAARLLKSTRKLGQMQTIAVGPVKPDNRRDLYDGHQRDSVWSKGYHPDILVWAMESNRPLTDKERKDVTMLTMTARGSFDWDALSGWADLGEYFEPLDLSGWKRDVAALGNFMASEQADIFKNMEFADEIPEEAREKGGANIYALTFPCDKEQREKIIRALNEIKKENGFSTVLEALMLILEEYADTQKANS